MLSSKLKSILSLSISLRQSLRIYERWEHIVATLPLLRRRISRLHLLSGVPRWRFLNRATFFRDFNNRSNATGWMIIGRMPVERAAGRLIHRTTTTWTGEGDRGILARRHILTPSFQDHVALHIRLQSCSGRDGLHYTPHPTDLTEGNTHFPKVLTASIPMIIGNGERATTPATPTSTAFTIMSQLMQQNATSFL